MVRFISIASVALCLLSTRVKPASPGPSSQIFGRGLARRVTGGSVANFADFPFAVSIGVYTKNKDTPFPCTGVLLSDEVVLTAAVCFKNNFFNENEISDIRVTVGSGKIVSHIKNRSIQYREKIVIPEFDANVDKTSGVPLIKGINNNLALIFLSEKVKDSGAKFAKIYPRKVTADMNVKVAGWGTEGSEIPGPPSEDLLQAPVKISTADVCKQYNIFWDDNKNQICTVTERNQNACMGDQGGPLVYKTDGVDVVVGIASFPGLDKDNKKCAVDGLPTYYTNVYHHIDWISEKIGISKDELIVGVPPSQPSSSLSDKISLDMLILLSLGATLATFIFSMNIFA
ncbi:Acrosin [Zancudomyces culisetae]|uniref:Acrosin n=1 Tax=Zancudomyces culisetae TaxID=1213189 RepID=A0A1R1PTR1_ZANCU|nr:Acrosin [Zancudomyces culisetae]|eukprot:OMH84350.1 Acrosin [Zancudomyces culisetae]